MKTFKESILSYVCSNGCGLTIYNSTREEKTCERCGGKLKKVNKPVKGTKRAD